MVEPMPIVDDAQIVAARVAGDADLQAARAVAVRYLPLRDRVEIELASGWSVQVPRSFSARLSKASTQDCGRIEIVDCGLGLHWPAVDEDWYVPAVIQALGIRHAA